jgi:hypothetical protein
VGLTLQAAISGSWPYSQDFLANRSDRHGCAQTGTLAVSRSPFGSKTPCVFAFWLARHGVRIELIRVASLRGGEDREGEGATAVGCMQVRGWSADVPRPADMSSRRRGCNMIVVAESRLRWQTALGARVARR